MEAQIGLLSAVIVAVLAIVGQVIVHKMQRKDTLTDTAANDNKKIFDKLQTISTEVVELKDTIEECQEQLKEESVIQARIRILRFADEILIGRKHTKDHFDQIMDDITRYEQYCSMHPHFPNNITVTSTQIIKENFKDSFEKNDFLS